MINDYYSHCSTAPLFAPESVQVMVHNSTLAEVHWEPVSPSSVRGKLQGYKVHDPLIILMKKRNSSVHHIHMKTNILVTFLQVYYIRDRGLHEPEKQAEQKEQVLVFSGNRSEGRLPGLQPYSVYNLSITVLNSKGEGPRSQSKTFETLEGGVYHCCGCSAGHPQTV